MKVVRKLAEGGSMVWHMSAGRLKKGGHRSTQAQGGLGSVQVPPSAGRPWVCASKERLREGMARCAGRLEGSLPQQLVIFPAGFSSHFAFGKLARKIANGNNIIAGHYNSCNFKDQLQL